MHTITKSDQKSGTIKFTAGTGRLGENLELSHTLHGKPAFDRFGMASALLYTEPGLAEPPTDPEGSPGNRWRVIKDRQH